MNRKEKPIWQRALLTVSVLALIGAAGYIYFLGLTLTTGIVVGVALATIATPVVIEGGGVIEILAGLFDAFLEGLMGVVDAITSFFSF